MTKQSTRRAILAGAATLPALALIPAMALAATGDVSFPELAARYASIYPRWLAKMKTDIAHMAAFNAEVEAATGISRDAEPPYDNDPTGYWNTLDAISKSQTDRDPCDEHGCNIFWNEMYDELYSFAEEILIQPPKSIADLALQAQVAAVINNQHWDDSLHNQEADGICLRILADNICKLAGVDILAGLEKQPLRDPLFGSNADDEEEAA